MIGNTNAKSGGGQNIGNESAVDLLNTMNTAKVDLANDLIGKGISANAEEETLQELVNKVPNILSDSSQTFQDCLTMNMNYDTSKSYSSFSNIPRINIRDYIVFNISDRFLKYVKKSDIVQSLSNDNVDTVIDTVFHNSEAFDSSDRKFISGKICANEDMTKLYVFYDLNYNNDPTHIGGFDINWSGDNITSITIDSNVNFYNFIGGVQGIGGLQCRKNYLMWNSSTGIHMLNLNDGTSFTLLSGNYGKNNYYDLEWIKDDEFVLIHWQNPNTINACLQIEHYSLNNFSTATLIKTTQSSILNKQVEKEFCNLVKTVEYDTGKFKIFINGNTSNNYDNVRGFMYDTYDKTLTELNGTIFNSNTSVTNIGNTDIAYFDNINKYVVCMNYCFFIFDQNFNQISNVSVSINTNTISATIMIFLMHNKIILMSDYRGVSFKYFYDKKTLIKKTKSVNDVTKEQYYVCQNITVSDIENGYFD